MRRFQIINLGQQTYTWPISSWPPASTFRNQPPPPPKPMTREQLLEWLRNKTVTVESGPYAVTAAGSDAEPFVGPPAPPPEPTPPSPPPKPPVRPPVATPGTPIKVPGGGYMVESGFYPVTAGFTEPSPPPPPPPPPQQGPISESECPPGWFRNDPGMPCQKGVATESASRFGNFGGLMNIASMAPAAAASGISLMGPRFPVVNV